MKKEVIKYSEIKEDFNFDILKEEGDGLAFLTHYLHQKNTKNGKYYNNSKSNEKFKNFIIDFDIEFPPVKKPKFTFIDLFAGIGGFRISMQSLGGNCVFSSEIDKFAKKTYESNFGEVPFGDITKIDEKDIPEHDILCAGFPCQTFSIAGKRKGFDETRGTLFFDIARIIDEKKPKALFLENVKGLRNHNKGETLKTILRVLRDELGYYVPTPEIHNAKYYGVPQNRERIFIVGFRNDLGINEFTYPKPHKTNTSFSVVKEKNPVSSKYYLSKRYVDTLINHKERHKNKGNGFGYDIISDDDCANAIVVGGMGKERNIVIDWRTTDFTSKTNIRGEVNRKGWRRMTPIEWQRLQGFPSNFLNPVSDTQKYKQYGNSVAIPAIIETSKKIVKKIKDVKRK